MHCIVALLLHIFEQWVLHCQENNVKWSLLLYPQRMPAMSSIT